MSVTIDLQEELLAGVLHVPEPEVPPQVLIELACVLYALDACDAETLAVALERNHK